MSQSVIQTSFNSGEWAPALRARVDLAKYHSGAALIRNFFVDYRGGATTRPGTRFVARGYSSLNVRVIPFQASLNVTYALEFGQGYIRFYNNGAPVVEQGKTVFTVTPGPPEVFNLTGHGYATNDWLFISGNYYIVQTNSPNNFTLTDLFGNPINTNPFSLPVLTQRVYTLLNSPYQSSDVFGIKYSQNVNALILCHPNYPPYQLVLNSTQQQPNWTLSAISFAPTIGAPGLGGFSLTLNPGGTAAFISYIATAVDANGQESNPSIPLSFGNNILGTTWTATIQIVAQPVGAVSYNWYKTIYSITGAQPAGIPYGFIGNSTTTAFIDNNIQPNFAINAPVIRNPFSGAGVQTLVLESGGSGFQLVPQVSILGGSPTTAAQAGATLFSSQFVLAQGGQGYQSGQVVNGPNGLQILILSTDSNGSVNGFTVVANALASANPLPPNPVSLNAAQSGLPVFQVNINWAISSLTLISSGAGYQSTPTVSFAPTNGASAGAILGSASGGNPTVPAVIQQRLFLGGLSQAPSQFNMSQPGAPYNFNVTLPAQDDNAIQASLNGTTLNSIKSAVAVSAGLVVFTDKGAWLINGGSGAGSPIGATAIVANAQGYSGASDLPPIVTPQDILYVQSKGSIVRDLAYNFYLNNYIGADISVLSSHLFYTYQMHDWCWAEEPFKVAWVARSDGVLLSLTFVKEQELIAWAQHTTLGAYQSICSIPENTTTAGIVDAVYHVVQRVIAGVNVNYIERFVELTFPQDYKSSWQVDAGIGYSGSPQTTFSGAQHLQGQAVTGVADGVVINFTMPTSGTFVFGPGGTPGLTGIPSASIVTVGLPFTPVLTTLPLDLGEPTVMGKRKKISGVTLKVNQALGLSMGQTQSSALLIQDLVFGNVGSMTNAKVTGLVSGDVRAYLDPDWNVPGQYTIVQPNPYPASILGVVPEIEVGDTVK